MIVSGDVDADVDTAELAVDADADVSLTCCDGGDSEQRYFFCLRIHNATILKMIFIYNYNTCGS